MVITRAKNKVPQFWHLLTKVSPFSFFESAPINSTIEAKYRKSFTNDMNIRLIIGCSKIDKYKEQYRTEFSQKPDKIHYSRRLLPPIVILSQLCSYFA